MSHAHIFEYGGRALCGAIKWYDGRRPYRRWPFDTAISIAVLIPFDKLFWRALNENRLVIRFAKPIEVGENNLFETGQSIFKISGNGP